MEVAVSNDTDCLDWV